MRAKDLNAYLDQHQPPLSSPVVVFGAGAKGREVCRTLQGAGYEITGVVDNYAKPGQRLLDFAVQTPQQWQAQYDASQHTAITAIHNFQVPMPPLLSAIAAMGFARVVNIVELYNLRPDLFPPHYWLTDSSFYRPFGETIEAVYGLFADELSRTWYRQTLQFRLSGDYGALPPPSPEDQYCPRDLPRWSSPLRLIDCGAFDGDSIRLMKHHGYELESVAAFEPDNHNFGHLARGLATHAGHEYFCFPCGVAGRTEMIRFAADQGMGSRADERGETHIQCVALDDVLGNYRPTLIKMDIEGAEPDALAGAQRMIVANRPGLAVSIYHHPAHIWQIPLLINDWGLNYSLYLRGHGQSSFDLVLYAIPNDNQKDSTRP